ncbi:MAG TPA: amidohydrolase family protein [Thermoanaerobaculia bacterium]|nr:amidohydrolase family protein [Thermoanaerobaculia bacterium]
MPRALCPIPRAWRVAGTVPLLVLLASSLAAQAPVRAFRGAQLHPIAGPPIEQGVLVVEGGRILAVGGSSTTIPRGAEVIDVGGKVILPGLVDTHSHLGSVSGGDRSAPLHPGVRALDSIDVRSDSFWRARAGGITTINVMPGSGLLMSGQTVYIKLRRDPRTIDDWLFCDDPIGGICGAMKMANGTNPLDPPPQSGSRAKSAALVRALYVKAQEYQHKVDEAAADSAKKAPPRDLELEALLQVLRGERIVQHHTHRHNDIATVLRLQQEFGFRVVIQHGSEAWKVADQLAAAKVPVSITFIDAPGGKEEVLGWRLDAPAILERAGVDVGFNTDDWITDSRLLLRAPALAVRYGMSREKALEGVTLAAARMLGLEERVGSLEPGKDADFVVLSGDPLSVYTQVEETWVEGERVFDRDDPEHRRFAVGGYRVYRDLATHHDVLESEAHQ